MPAICVLNMSNDLSASQLVLGAVAGPEPIKDPAAIPETDPLVLYVVGHAIPNGLFVTAAPGAAATRVSEAVVAHAIAARRGNQPTLVIWDTCFAASFLAIPNFTWTDNFVHMFSCQAHERSWHSGGVDKVTLFSDKLKAALVVCREAGACTWTALEDELRKQLGNLQTPQIVSFGPAPSAFDLFD
ncbi:MAG TPA: hypothetical protein VK540_22930 [Polyangiaceae bacterium]|nr:hypothetical protein [Polyangiaceae bacterium]